MPGLAPSVVILAPAAVGPSATGPARRTVMLAEALGEHCRVTLAVPAGSEEVAGPHATVTIGDAAALAALVARHDVTISQVLPSPRALALVRRNAPRLVADILAPFSLEEAQMPGGSADAVVRWRTHQLLDHLALADLVLCSNPRQADLLLGVGLTGGLVAPRPPAVPLHERLLVVPLGIDDATPVPQPPALRTGELVGDAPIVVWAGGAWSWFDPLTAVRGIELVAGRRPDVRLAFIGLEHPSPEQRRAHAPGLAEAMAHARDRGLSQVVFRPEWLTRDAYLGQLLEADAGIALSRPGLEARFATRTRVGDYLQAGLPVICTRGDTMADFVDAHRLGATIEPGDAEGCAAAIDVQTRPGGRPSIVPETIDRLRWTTVAAPIVDWCRSPPSPRAAAPRALLTRTAAAYPAFLRSVAATHGPRTLAAAVVRRAFRR